MFNNIQKISFIGVFVTVTLFSGVVFSQQAFALGTSGCETNCPTPTPTPTPNPTPSSNPPICDISLSASVANEGDKFTLTWNGRPTNATFKINNFAVADSGSAIYTYPAGMVSVRYVMTGQNGDGNCVKEVVIRRATPAVTPTCDIVANVSTVSIGGQYKITWNGTPATGIFKVNGKTVAASGSATYTFVGPNKETFTFTGENSGRNCSDVVVVTKTPVVVPAPTCVINVSPTSIVRGSSAQLSWTSQNAVSASINQGIGSVAVNGNRSVSPTQNLTYTMTVTNSAGITATCARAITVTIPTPSAPICNSFTANPTSIVRGSSATLTWATTNATAVSINQGVGAVAVDGTRVVSPTNTITYTLTATKDAQSVTCPVTVTVTDVPTPSAPTCDTFTASPASITRGQNAYLAWTTTNATAVTITNVTGALPVDGTKTVTPTNTTVYTLTATGAGGTVTCAAPVTVIQPTAEAPRCDNFDATPVTINRGESSVLSWNTTNANSASINNAIGAVAVDGSRSVSPVVTTDYILTLNSNDNQTASCVRRVTVIQPNTAITCAANVNFSVNPSSIRRGDSSTLTWDTTGLTGVRFDNLNVTGLDGSVTISPNDSITYTLIGTKGSETINCPVSINVNQPSNGGGGSSAPKCTLKISDSKISLGERVTLKWDTTRATEITIKDNHGKTLIDTDDKSSSEKKDLYDGEITIRPDKDTTYTLVASKGSRDKTCKVSVDVEDTIVVTQIRDQQPLVTGIALTQVPYTGFEAGPFMTSVFFTLLAAWALYMAYVLVGRRNGMSAFTPATVTADIVPETIMFPETVTSTPAFYQAPAAVVASTATVGYAAHTDVVASIEAQAHQAHVLLSADALAHIASITSEDNVTEVSTTLFALAKESFPSEDGYVTLTNERLATLLA